MYSSGPGGEHTYVRISEKMTEATTSKGDNTEEGPHVDSVACRAVDWCWQESDREVRYSSMEGYATNWSMYVVSLFD